MAVVDGVVRGVSPEVARAVAVEAWVLPGGGVASFAAGGVVAVVDCCVAVDVVVGVGRVRERERA